MRLRYAPGSQLLVARRGLAFLTADEQLAHRVWATVDAPGWVDDLLVEIVRGGLRTAAGFVLVESSDEQVRVLVRGDLPVRVRGAAATVTWTGTGITTWAERVFDRVDDILVGVTDGSEVDAGEKAVDVVGDRLPLREGMVRCSGFLLQATERGPVDTPPETVIGTATDGAPGPASPDATDQPPINQPPILGAPVTEPPATGAPVIEVPVIEVPVIEVPVTEVPITGVPAGEMPADPAQTRTAAPDDGFDHLFESTIVRSVEDAAVRDTPETDATSIVPLDDVRAGPAPRLGDHDGSTITAAELGARRPQIAIPDPVGSTPPSGARLEVSTGDVVALDRDVVIGRRPEVDRVQGGPVPTVLTVPSPRQDVSRTHLRIGWSGSRMVATDLHSMNGTVVLGADGTTCPLAAGVPQALVDGDTLDVGDGVTLTLRLTVG